MILQLENPIPRAIRDPADLSDLFEKYQLMPFFGDDQQNSHSILVALEDLGSLSPSHIACKGDRKDYTVGIGFEVYDGEKEIEEKTFIDNLSTKTGISKNDILGISKKFINDLDDVSNFYLKIKIVQVGSEKKVFLTSIPYTDFAYILTKVGTQKYGLITEKFEEAYWRDNKPQVLPVFELDDFIEYRGKTAIKEAIIHIKEDNDRTVWYTRPKTIAIMNEMLSEYLYSDLNVKISNTETTAKYIMAIPEPNPTRNKGDNKGKWFEDTMFSLRQLTTREGDEPKTIAGFSYPFDATHKPELHSLNVNRDEAYMSKVLDLAAKRIHGVHRWSTILTNFDEVSAGIGGNVLKDVFHVKNTTTIIPLQYRLEEFWDWILTQIEEDFGTIQGRIKFKDNIAEMIKSLGDTSEPEKNEENAIAAE